MVNCEFDLELQGMSTCPIIGSWSADYPIRFLRFRRLLSCVRSFRMDCVYLGQKVCFNPSFKMDVCM